MENIIKHAYRVSREDRNKQNGHSSFVIWFTGLSGSGKSTIANALEEALFRNKIHTYSLDGDNIRSRLNKDLTFSEKDRNENIKRIAEVARLFVDAGLVTIAAFISPTKRDRQVAKEIIGEDNFLEIFINTPLSTCEKRDVKNLYKKARAGKIEDFTGVNAPYEAPGDLFMEIRTEDGTAEESVQRILENIEQKLKLK